MLSRTAILALVLAFGFAQDPAPKPLQQEPEKAVA